MHKTVFSLKIEVLRKNYDMTDRDQMTAFYHEIARKLLVFSDKVQRDNYLEAVAANIYYLEETI